MKLGKEIRIIATYSVYWWYTIRCFFMTYYAFSAFLTFLTSLSIGFFVLFGNRKNKINISFFIFTCLVSLWSLSYYFWQITPSASSALFLTRLLMAFAIYIPVAYTQFVFEFLSLKKNIFIFFSYLVFTVFLYFDTTPFFVKTVIPYLGFPFWPVAGLVFGIFLFIWWLYILYALYLLFQRYKNTSGNRKLEAKYLLIGIAIAFLSGSSNFLMWYHIPVPPFLNILSPIYVAMTAYSIVRFQSFNVKLVEAQAFVIALIVLIGSEFFFVSTLIEHVLIAVTVTISIGTGILLVRSVKREIALRESLQSANEGQVNLIHIMNHQIKGYLGKDKNVFAELLDGDYGKVPDEARSLIQEGLQETDAGVNYVTEILRGASAENGTLPYDMKPIDLKEIIVTVAGKEKAMAEKRGLAFNLNIEDGDYRMTGDATQLTEAFRNLMDNSIYYTLKGGIVMHLSRKGNTISFSIQDTGVGIREEDRPKVFRAGGVGRDSIKINVQSSGYGMPFTKGVIDAHKGKVWFESEGENKGSTFFVELPVK